LAQWAPFGLPLYSIQRETFHEFIYRIRDQEVKFSLMGGERKLEKALSWS
jgi:hypothetical protein